MCTVVWTGDTSGYDVLMNRDELHTRGRALSPQPAATDGVEYLAPVDVDAGGTWIGVNQKGLTVCLLNYYPAEFTPDPTITYISRGGIIPSLMACATVGEARAKIQSLDLAHSRPFTLMVLGKENRPVQWDSTVAQWNGSMLSWADAPAVLTSSSFHSAEVEATRIATYGELVPDNPTTDDLRHYLQGHLPEKGPSSVCAHRDDGGSKSLCHISVRYPAAPSGQADPTVSFHYHDGPPCQDAPSSQAELTG